MNQYTIATQIAAQSSIKPDGKPVSCLLKPASENSGIVLRRIDLAARPEFRLTLDALKSILPNLKHEYFDLESYLPLLAVLRAMKIDNVVIECGSETMPYMGESASVLLFLVQSAGIKELNSPRKFIELKKPLMLKSKSCVWTRFMPSNKKRLAILNSNSTESHQVVIKNAMAEFTLAFFTSELCHARSEHAIEKEAHEIVTSNSDDYQQKYARLSKEKTQRVLFEVFSILSLLPYSLNADYVGFNASGIDNLSLLQKLLNSNAFEIKTDSTLTDNVARAKQRLAAV